MQNYKVVNRVFAGLAFLLSLIVYLRTIAPTVSFWDCGEFITCSYILGIPHPPGAPFYLLIGRIFTMLPIASDIGLRVNIISALATALTVMLTYLIIVRLVKQWRGVPQDSFDMFILVASGLLGSMAFAFTDTLWFNAVEAEVYAISAAFTAVIVWLILVWLEKADQKGSERYLLFIAYLVGLAIGVHLLMVLALPAIFLIVYYHILDRRGERITFKNLLIFALVTGAAFAVVYPGVVQYIPRMAGSLGIWILPIIILAIVLGIAWAVSDKKKITALALMSILLVLTGYSTYTMIYIRSNKDPAVDENDPETMQKMVSYLNREQYGTWGTFPRRFNGLPPKWQFEQQYPNMNYDTYQWDKQMDFLWNYQIKKMYLRYFGWQYIGKGTTIGEDGYIKENLSLNGLWALPFLVGVLGMVHHFRKHRRHGFMVLALFLLTGLAIVIYLNQEDPQPRERDYVYVGSYFAFALWIGIGVTAVLEWIKDAFTDKKMRTIVSAVFAALFILILPVNLIAHNYHSHDRTGNYVAYDYSYNILQTCEKDAVVFTNGDNDTFPLWFLQYVYDIRTDVRVVNLSLLNTPWYIKQLKHQEPKVPISLSDDRIEDLQLMMWEEKTIKIPVTKKAQEEALAELQDKRMLLDSEEYEERALKFKLKPTVMGRALRIQDFMILNIILANQWEKPMYFAVTVSNQNKLNLDDYLRMDGLSFKLVPYKVDHVNAKKLERNLFKVFRFRGLNDPDVYFNDNIKGLLQNYRAAFLRLAYEYQRQDKSAEVGRVLDKMEEFIPFEIIPVPDPRLILQVGQMYEYAGQPDDFLRLAKIAYNNNPENAYVVGSYVSLLERNENYDKALNILREWRKANPSDSEAQKKINQLETLMNKQDTVAQ